MKTFQRIARTSAGLIVGLLVAAAAFAQEKFPARPVTIMVGFAPGGSTDLIIRAMAKAAEESLGQPVIVVNTPGAGGTVALANLMAKKGDGYTLATLTTGAITAQYTRDVPFKVLRDFTPVTDVIYMPSGLLVKADSPWKTLKDFVEYARQNPKKISYSSAGIGLSQHLAMEKLALSAGIDVVHVPYKGGMEAVMAVLGNHVQAVSQTPEWAPHVDQGALRLLAVYSDKRMEQYPSVPTLKEQGYNFVMSAFVALVGPKGVPADRAQVLANAFKKALNDPGFIKVRNTYFMSAALQDPEAFAKSLAETDADLKDLIGKIGLKQPGG